jgi:hypothetical protein
MQTNQTIRFAGDVNVEQITLTSRNGFTQNITNQVVGVELFEDLFSTFLSGNIIVKDSLDLINLFPIVGEEKVKIKINTPSFEGFGKVIDNEFYIYKLSDVEFVADKSKVYRLHFISSEAIVDVNKRISKSFSGKVSDIVKEIVNNQTYGLETKKFLNIEDTANSTKYVSNFWSPIVNINYLTGNAVTSESDPNYIFFENRTGFNFISLTKLYTQASTQMFVNDSWLRDFDNDTGNRRNVEEEYKRIIEISIPSGFNYMDNIRAGMYSSKIITYDIVTKKYASKHFNILDGWKKESNLNPYPLVSNKHIDSPWSTVIREQKYFNNFDKYSDVTNTNTLQKRISQILQAEGNRIEIVVPGRTDYTVGQKVEIKLYKNQPTSKEDTDFIDNVNSGFYIISAVNHFFTREKHECRMELIKNSYNINLDLGGKK